MLEGTWQALEMSRSLPPWQLDGLACVVWIMAGQDLWPAEVSDQSLRAFVNISHLQKIIKKRGKNTQDHTTRLCQSDYFAAFALEVLSHFKT